MEKLNNGNNIYETYITDEVKTDGNKSQLLKISTYFLAFFVLISFVLYHTVTALSAPVLFYTVKRVENEECISLSGHIFGDFIPVSPEVSGEMAYIVDDGEKIPNGCDIAYILDTDDSAVMGKYYLLSAKISMLNSIITRKLTLSSESSEKDIKDAISKADCLTVNKKYVSAETQYDTILPLLTEANGENIEEYFAQAISQMKELISSAKILQTVTAETSGFFYKNNYGRNGLFSGSRAENMTYDDFVALISVENKDEYESAGCILADFQWYFVCNVTEDFSSRFSLLHTYECSFKDNTYTDKLKMTPINKDTGNDGNTVITFRCTSIPKEFSFTDCQTANFTLKKNTGLYVPSSYIKNDESGSYVTVFHRGTVEKRKIDIISKNNGYCIVGDYGIEGYLTVNDMIITNRQNLKEGTVFR